MPYAWYYGRKELGIGFALITKALYLKVIASVNQEGIRNWIHIKPLSVVLNLQASDFILDEEGKEAVVGVRGDADC